MRVLDSMPAYLETLPFAEGMELLSLAAWPCRLVEEQGAVAGFVMPAIPDAFFLQMKKSSGMSREAAEFQHLLNNESFLARRAITVSDRDRYELLREVARALSVFHRHGIAVGDLSPKNLLFTCGQAPGVYFIDCDAMRFQGQSVMPQLETPGWEVRGASAHEELGTAASDSYKLGLLALRLLTGTQDGRDPDQLPPAVPTAIRKLVKAALSGNPAQRPKPPDWTTPLETAASTASAKSPQATSTSAKPPQAIKTPVTTPPVTVARPLVGQSAGSTQGRVSTSSKPGGRRRRWSRRRLLATGVLSVLAVAGAAIGGTLLFNKPSPPATPEVLVAVSPNGKFIASGDFLKDSVYIWTIATKRVTATLSFPGGVRDFSFSSDSKMLVVAPDFGHVTIWSITGNRTVATINNPRTDSPYCVALSPDEKMLAVCSSNSTNLYLVDIARRSISATLHPVGSSTCGGAGGAAFSPDGKVLAVAALPCSGDNRVQLWDISTRRITASITGFYPLVYSHDGSMLAAGGTLVWQDPGTNGSIWEIKNSSLDSQVAFSPDDKTLAAPDGPTGTTFVWSVSTKHKIAAFTDPSSEGATGVAYTPDGKTLVVADGNEHIYLWNIATRITATLANPNS